VVLTRAATCAALVALGCGQSLFDAHGPGPGPGSSSDAGGEPPGVCNFPCIADAAADYDGSMTGKGGRWQYLEDNHDRTWSAMIIDGTQMKSEDSTDRITSCTAQPDAPACSALPGALLVTSTGAGHDPAISFTAASAQVIELRLRAYQPSGTAQDVWLYRNSREDALFIGQATAGTPLDRTVALDALAGDRFLVAIGPNGAPSDSVSQIALDLTVNATTMAFPSACQLMLSFESVVGNSTRNLCREQVFSLVDASLRQVQLARPTSPYVALGVYSAHIPTGAMFHDFAFMTDTPLDHSQSLTVQLWVERTVNGQTMPATPFSDLDLDYGGGFQIVINPGANPTLQVAIGTTPTPTYLTTPYPDDGSWHFIRVVQSTTGIALCIDGKARTDMPVDTTSNTNFYVPELGNESPSLSNGQHFEGNIDDVRAFTGTLPCSK
jgi:hypothetical protein